jgi:thiol:disulfide interchange protein DsbD
MDVFLSQIDTYLNTSLLSSLVVAYLGGVLASLTPCVYPMIPITAGVIGHANIGGSKLRGFFLSLTYVLGMALTYAALGVFAASTGRFFGMVNLDPQAQGPHLIQAEGHPEHVRLGAAPVIVRLR